MGEWRPAEGRPGKETEGRAALRRAAEGARWLAVLLAVALPLLGLACGGGSPPTAVPIAAATPAPSPKVAILSLDGLRPEAFQQDLPNLQSVARRGAYTFKEQTIASPTTLPAHASMVSGQDPSVHRVNWNSYQPEKGYISVPTIFSIAKSAGLRTVMVVGKEKLKQLAAPGTVDSLVFATRGDDDVANEAIVQVQAGFDLMFVHFPDIDLTGHAKGWLSAAYMAQVVEADQAVGRLLAELPVQTTVILTSDHGGRGTVHGYNIPEDMTVPWMIAGPRVPPRGELSVRVKETDTAATALYVLGLSLPPGSAGEVVQDAFSPY